MRKAMLIATAAVLTAGVALPAAAAPAAHSQRWREDYISVRGAQGPGPAQTERVHVLRVGPPNARRVLVLVPAQFIAAGEFRPLAEALARRVPDTQVWAVDRRETNLEDPAGFRSGNADRAAEYYLGGRYRSATAASAPYAAGWGLTVTVDDLRQVVLAARDGGHRQVVLGGHSWGAATTLAYAGWDFDGHPGYEDLSGLVLIDGGVHDAFAGEGDIYRVTARQARAGLDQIAAGTVFDPAITMGRPETFQVLQQLAAMYAKSAPDAPSTLAGQFPAPVRPPGPVTDAGLLNWLYVEHPLVADLSINPAYTSLTALAAMNAASRPGSFEWYWPQRLSLDLAAADAFTRTPATDVLGLRIWHARQIDVPLYTFQSGLTHGTVNRAAHWVVDHSRIPWATYDGDDEMTHVDVVAADPNHNPMLASLVPFLTDIDQR